MSLDTVTLERRRAAAHPAAHARSSSTARRSPRRTAATARTCKKGTDSRSLDAEEQLFTVTLDEAAALFAQPKQRGRRAAAAPPLKELGDDPVSGKPMVVKDGRFGPYVTDGETNASLRARRLGRRAHRRAGRRAARRPARARPGEEGAPQGPGEEGAGKEESPRQEGAREGAGRKGLTSPPARHVLRPTQKIRRKG